MFALIMSLAMIVLACAAAIGLIAAAETVGEGAEDTTASLGGAGSDAIRDPQA